MDKNFYLRHKGIIFLLAAITIGTVLRLYHFTSAGIWHDEAFSGLLIQLPWKEMLTRIGLDVHPPAYYVVLRLWSDIFGVGVASLRGFSLFFGVMTIVLSWALARSLDRSNTSFATITAFFVATSLFQIQYVSEARMYTFGAFLAVFGTLCLVKVLKWETTSLPEGSVFWWYAGFVISSLLMMYTHYYLLFTVAALVVYGKLVLFNNFRWGLRKYKNWSIACLVIILLYLPWLKTFLFQFKQVSADYWIPQMDRWSIPTTIWRLVIGSAIDPHKLTSATLLVISCIVMISLMGWLVVKYRHQRSLIIIIAFLAPFLGSLTYLLLGYLRCHLGGGAGCKINSVYLERYFLYSSSFALIILAWFISTRGTLTRKVLALSFVLLNLALWHKFWKDLDISKKPGMGAAAMLLHSNVQPGDHVIVASSFEFFNLRYYTTLDHTSLQTNPYLYTPGIKTVSDLPHYSGTALLSDEDLVHEFNRDTKLGDTVWVIWTTGFGGSKPTPPSNWTQTNEWGYEDVRPYAGTWVVVTQYKVSSGSANTLAEKISANEFKPLLNWSRDCERNRSSSLSQVERQTIDRFSFERDLQVYVVKCGKSTSGLTYELFSMSPNLATSQLIFPLYSNTSKVVWRGELQGQLTADLQNQLIELISTSGCPRKYFYSLNSQIGEIETALQQQNCSRPPSENLEDWKVIDN